MRFRIPSALPAASDKPKARRRSDPERLGNGRTCATAASPTATAPKATAPPSTPPLPSVRSGKYRLRKTATATTAATPRRLFLRRAGSVTNLQRATRAYRECRHDVAEVRLTLGISGKAPKLTRLCQLHPLVRRRRSPSRF